MVIRIATPVVNVGCREDGLMMLWLDERGGVASTRYGDRIIFCDGQKVLIS